MCGRSYCGTEEADSKFKVGDRVRVAFEDVVHKLKFGSSGTVKSVVDEDHLAVDLDSGIAPVVLQADLLQDIGGKGKARQLRNLVRVPAKTKRLLLMAAGHEHPEETTLSQLRAQDKELLDEHVDLYGAIVRWTLDLLDEVEVQVVPLQLSRLVLEGHLKEPQGPYTLKPDLPEVHEKRLRCVRSMFKASKLMLVPLFGMNPGHFTLLAIEKKCEGEEVAVRYYETLHKPHASCRRNAEAILEILGIDASNLKRTNMARQSGVECGFMVCHYLEENLRHFVGEGWATQGWPEGKRMRDIREAISKTAVALEAARAKWAAEQAEAQKSEVALLKNIADAARTLLEAKGLSAKLAAAQEALAGLLVHVGAGPKAPDLPEGFGKKDWRSAQQHLQLVGTTLRLGHFQQPFAV